MELEPCPFCGNTNLLTNYFPDEGIISCSCGARMRAGNIEEHYVHIAEDLYRKVPSQLGAKLVAEAWNRRANDV